MARKLISCILLSVAFICALNAETSDTIKVTTKVEEVVSIAFSEKTFTTESSDITVTNAIALDTFAITRSQGKTFYALLKTNAASAITLVVTGTALTSGDETIPLEVSVVNGTENQKATFTAAATDTTGNNAVESDDSIEIQHTGTEKMRTDSWQLSAKAVPKSGDSVISASAGSGYVAWLTLQVKTEA